MAGTPWVRDKGSLICSKVLPACPWVSTLRLVRARAQLFQLFGEFPYNLGKLWPFSGGDPFQPKPLPLDAEII